MGSQSWIDRDRKKTSKRAIKNLGKPFRRASKKDSKESREWSKHRRELRRLEEQDSEDVRDV